MNRLCPQVTSLSTPAQALAALLVGADLPGSVAALPEEPEERPVCDRELDIAKTDGKLRGDGWTGCDKECGPKGQ